MRLLLDTHIWLWAAVEPHRLAPSLLSRMADPATELWLSPISLWEALLLAERGRIRVEGAPEQWVHQMVAAIPRREAPLTGEIAMASRRLRLEHEDPADRFLAATARVMALTLVTADVRLLRGTGYATLGNE
jgi:PIN domain nuclease of toxin-antitoxin system